jgi:glycosyltransferase involved in cell wall biosynthesis
MNEVILQPLVSVVMIFLNAEKFMQDAIESVLTQKYTKWELVLVDDGSTDSSTAIAQNYARRYPDKIYYVEHENHQNRGMSASRNLGIRESKGKYVAFLDADDFFFPEKLMKQVSILERHPQAAMTYGPTQYWHSWTGQVDDLSRDHMRTVGVQTDCLYPPPEMVVRFLENIARTPGTCSVLIRREAIEEIGGFEECFTGMFEDQAFLYKLCLHEPVYVESECLSRYRQHPDSYCNVSRQNGTWNVGSRHPRTRVIFLSWLEEYLTEQKITAPLIWRILGKQLRSYRHPKLDYLLSFIHRLKSSLRMRMRQLW